MRLQRRAALGLFTAGLLAIALAMPAGAAIAAGSTAEPDPTDISSYAPADTTDVARGAHVTASSSYEMAGEGWSAAKLVDGVLASANSANGWSTSPYDKVTDPATPATADVVMASDALVQRVVLFPRSDLTYGSSFPARYSVSLLDDSGSAVFSQDLTQAQPPTAPVVIDLQQPVAAKTIRLSVGERGGPNTGDGYLVQLSELAAFGTAVVKPPTDYVSIDKPALLLQTGATSRLPFTATAANGTPVVQWSTSDASVASVDQTGLVTAIAAGTAKITLAEPATDTSASISVSVQDKVKRAGDDFMITAFWPMAKAYVNDEQFANLAAAGVNFLQVVPTSDLTDKSTQLKMAELAAKYGMQIGVADDRFGDLTSLTDDQITSIVNEYKDVPGVGGFYVDDEPSDATAYARVYNDMKKAAPDYYAHLNFLPSGSYGSDQNEATAMQKWVDQVGNDDYLMYDRYPFGTTANSLDYAGFLGNLNAVRQVGLRNGVKTATYIQATGVPNGFRRTNAAEIRYETNMAIAYGYKQLSYFTWFTPTNRPETFTNAIIAPDGTKTDLYQPVQQLDAEVQKLGPTLMKLDAEQVYLNGSSYGQQSVPSDFFVHAPSADNLTFSYLRDRATGRNYLMVVNNDFTQAVSTHLTFDSSIGSLDRISKQSGGTEPVTLSGSGLDLQLDKGDSALYELPATYDYDKRPTPVDVNLAANASVVADKADTSNGWSAAQVTDGVRFGNTTTNGWITPAATSSAEANLTVDLGRVVHLDRADLYPAGDLIDYGSSFPQNVRVEVSSDGNAFTPVAEISGQSRASGPSTVTFSPVDARFLRVHVLSMNETSDGFRAGLAELEVYNDDGKTPSPAKPPTIPTPPAYTAGANVALNKTVVVSSTTPSSYEQWGWAPRFLVDGSTANGWTSNVGQHSDTNAVEWAAVALGASFDVNDIKVYPTGSFAVDYKVQISRDGIEWMTVASISGDNGSTASPRDFALGSPTQASFVRVISSKLRTGGSVQDGTLMQIADLQVFGNPSADRSTLEGIIAKAEALPESHYTIDSWGTFSDVLRDAKAVEAAAYPYQYELDAAAARLTSAIGALVSYPSWNAGTVYQGGAVVLYQGNAYTAQWYSKNEVPGASPWSSWEQIGEPVVTSMGPVAAWTASWVYHEGDKVAYGGHVWQAKWWSRNEKPGDPNGPWKDLGTY
ncbi:MAG: discoidin domain-containing protein [Humibacter sp.]